MEGIPLTPAERKLLSGGYRRALFYKELTGGSGIREVRVWWIEI